MNQPARTSVKAAVLAMFGIAALVVTAISGSAMAAARPQPRAGTAAATASVPVVINCAMHAQTRPSQYVLACADGNAYLTGLDWAAWGSASAFASGTYRINDCVPDCVAGHFHSFPALVALWRAESLPGHPGERYFSRLTMIFTGSRTYRAGGKLHHLPATATLPLSASGGA